MIDVCKVLEIFSIPPAEKEPFTRWLEQKDALAFLKDNLHHDEFIIYANLPHTFIHAIFIPANLVDPPDTDDLISWNCDATSSWGICQFFNEPNHPQFSIEKPLSFSGSKTLDKGEQIVFARSFEGYIDGRNYFEILQKFTHSLDLHFVPEKKAYCRIDKLGEIEDFIRIVAIPDRAGGLADTVICCKRDLVDEYMALTSAAIVRTFDFTRYSPEDFQGWGNPQEELIKDGDLFYKMAINPGNESYTRGCQIVHPLKPDDEIFKRHGFYYKEEEKYETFIAIDLKNNEVKEMSCAPERLGNYFVESDFPFGTSPAFFRPDVLLKYKSDTEKYSLKDRSISCRDAWHLKTYDINEQGQVHTYLIYLSRLPYEEQLYWKSFNEKPKGTISKRAYKTDFEASWDFEYDPLTSLREVIFDLEKQDVSWWTLRSNKLVEQVHYPATTSADEWGNEIHLLDKLLVEGFEIKWFQKKAVSLGRTPDNKLGSLKLLRECLVGLDYEIEHAKEIIAPFIEVHLLRTKLKGHASGQEAQDIKKRVLSTHGSYKEHFKKLVQKCDQSMRVIIEALISSQ